mmetsp:Transcript_18914/g.43992  ORF Transcript_18914/g.43992 Transcript_18914/m.43992 type:complete len:115 (+) Transcript_18914:503-847(+)
MPIQDRITPTAAGGGSPKMNLNSTLYAEAATAAMTASSKPVNTVVAEEPESGADILCQGSTTSTLPAIVRQTAAHPSLGSGLASRKMEAMATYAGVVLKRAATSPVGANFSEYW